MYEPYTHQSLPSKEYRELLGSALCVFNSNNAFIIENILRLTPPDKQNWQELIDLESGKLSRTIQKTITGVIGTEVEELFRKIVSMRNRIIHSYRITNPSGEQTLATKEKPKDGGKQFEITQDYLFKFISLNDELSNLLHQLRGF